MPGTLRHPIQVHQIGQQVRRNRLKVPSLDQAASLLVIIEPLPVIGVPAAPAQRGTNDRIPHGTVPIPQRIGDLIESPKFSLLPAYSPASYSRMALRSFQRSTRSSTPHSADTGTPVTLKAGAVASSGDGPACGASGHTTNEMEAGSGHPPGR